MKVVFCSAEVAPFSQAGGLGDVAGSLPRALVEQGAECIIITPLYGLIQPEKYNLEKTSIHFDIQLLGKHYSIGIWHGMLPNSNVQTYFVDEWNLFGSRQQVYPYGQPEWELEGFLVFSQATFELLRHLHYRPDILHVHDWHTASVATTLAEIRPFDQYFSRTHSVLTIHNISYQGQFGEINWLQEGILKADAVTTVSPTYAQEIQTPEFGAGLEQTMQAVASKVHGILNGIDTERYNPQTDPHLPVHYSQADFETEKARCKAILQEELGLPVDPKSPLVGFIGRLAEQKGVDLIIPTIESMQKAGTSVQWVLLGTGNPELENRLRALSQAYANVHVHTGFDGALAQKIYAASDIFAMPSAFEPCGLGQLISLRYGTVPVVRSVGGLVDTIVDVRLQPHRGNGFKFLEYSAEKLEETLRAAIDYYNQPSLWHQLVLRGIQEDHSWRPSAEAYLYLYESLIHPGNTELNMSSPAIHTSVSNRQ